MKTLKVIVVVLVCGFLGWGVYNLRNERQTLEEQVFNLASAVKSLQRENSSLSENIEYYQNPENLLKVIKSQFNYRDAGEGLIIIVPSVTSTPTSTR